MSFCNLDKAIYDGKNKYEFPELEPFTESIQVSQWLRFTDIRKGKINKQSAVHFFEEDYKFESIWNRPLKYLDKFKQSAFIVQPDFSMYTDFPKVIQMYNKYRNHWLARFYSDRGIKVMPYIMWSTPDNYDWCFDGMPKESIVAITTNGTLKNEIAHKYFIQGFEEMQKRLNPIKILVFTVTNKVEKIGLNYDNIQYINCSVKKTLKL